jgi:hypothetical protein
MRIVFGAWEIDNEGVMTDIKHHALPEILYVCATPYQSPDLSRNLSSLASFTFRFRKNICERKSAIHDHEVSAIPDG